MTTGNSSAQFCLLIGLTILSKTTALPLLLKRGPGNEPSDSKPASTAAKAGIFIGFVIAVLAPWIVLHKWKAIKSCFQRKAGRVEEAKAGTGSEESLHKDHETEVTGGSNKNSRKEAPKP